MPLNAEPDPEKGTVVLLGDPPLALPVTGIDPEGRKAARRHKVLLYVSHFADCPHADQWRKR